MLIIGAAILVVAVVIVALTGVLGTGKDKANTQPIDSTYTGLRDIIDLGYGKTIITLVLVPGENVVNFPSLGENPTLINVFGDLEEQDVDNTQISFSPDDTEEDINAVLIEGNFLQDGDPTNIVNDANVPIDTNIIIIIPGDNDITIEIDIGEDGNEPIIFYQEILEIQSPLDITNPTLNIISISPTSSNVTFSFEAFDNNLISKFDYNYLNKSNINDFNSNLNQFFPTRVDGNRYNYDFNELFSDSNYLFCIRAMDFNNNSIIKCFETKTLSLPQIINPNLDISDGGVDLFIQYPTENIIELSTCQDLNQKIDSNVFGVFVLKNDIDCASITNFETLNKVFFGKLDGNNHTISNLNIIKSANVSYDSSVAYLGFFSRVENALIQRIKFVNTNITQHTISQNVGLVSGYATNSTFFRVSAQGKIDSNKYIGGLTGYLHSSNLWNSSSNVDINGERYVGGITGYSYQSNIKNTYSIGTINGTDTVGGLVGGIQESQVLNSYSTNSVKSPIKAGGLIGAKTLSNIINSTTITNSFWNVETSNQTISDGGTGKTTSELKNQSTFTDWNFITDWKIDSTINSGYPYLR